jgi:SAM-dependent methyltransferase
VNRTLQKRIHCHHFAHAEAYDRRAGKVFRGVYRVAEDVAMAAPTGGAVLDAGCGSGRLAFEIAKRRPDLRVHGIDLERGIVEVATRHAEQAKVADRVEFTVADLADLPLPDDSVDLIVSTASLHHWTDVSAVIASLNRVLRPQAESGSTTSAGSPPEACAPPRRASAAASTERSSAPDGSLQLSSSGSRSNRRRGRRDVGTVRPEWKASRSASNRTGTRIVARSDDAGARLPLSQNTAPLDPKHVKGGSD